MDLPDGVRARLCGRWRFRANFGPYPVAPDAFPGLPDGLAAADIARTPT